MLGSIEELEREIDVFQNNIKNSNNLMDIIKKTSECLEENSKQIDQLTEELSLSTKALSEKIMKENQRFQNDFFNNLSLRFETIRANLAAECENICSELESTQSSVTDRIKAESDKACDQIRTSAEQMAQLQYKLESLNKELSSIKQEILNEISDINKESFSSFETEFKNALSDHQKIIDEIIAGTNERITHFNVLIEEQQDNTIQLQGQIGSVSQQYLQTKQLIEMLSIQTTRLAKKQTIWSIILYVLIVAGIILSILF